MHGTEYQTLSNRELLLACENKVTADGFPLALQLELFSRFCDLAPLDESPAIDPRQLELPL